MVNLAYQSYYQNLFQHAGKWADNWKLQQDNAPPHKTATNMAFIADHVPAGHFLAWPANSPDLSPIESLWAWMDSKLGSPFHPVTCTMSLMA